MADGKIRFIGKKDNRYPLVEDLINRWEPLLELGKSLRDRF